MSSRDVAREQVWLRSAEQSAGASGFADHALRRLEAGDHLYGDRWVRIGLDALIDELLAEAADLGSWGVLALEAVERVQGVDEADRELIVAAVQATLLWGAFSHHALAIARGHLGDQQRESRDA